MTVTPIVPVNRERLVPVDTSIIIDFTGTPTRVDVNDVTVFDGSFQAGWTGSLLNRAEGGKRLVLDPPSDFALGDLVTVDVWEDGVAVLDYVFECGTRRITTSDDAISPRVTRTGNSPNIEPYVAYVRNAATVHLRRDDPLTPEIQVVEGNVLDIGWDPTLQKLVVFFVNNGKVFVTTADPGDGPTALTQPSALSNRMTTYGMEAGRRFSTSFATFPPLKLGLVDNASTYGMKAGRSYATTGLPAWTVTASVVTFEPLVARFPRPSGENTRSLAVGFIPIKFVNGAGRRMPFVPLPPDVPFVDVEYPEGPPDARFKAIVVYKRGEDGPTLLESAIGGSAAPTMAADLATVPANAAGRTFSTTFVDFPPLKLAVPLDTIRTYGMSAGVRFNVTTSGFPPIGVGQ